MLSSVLCLALLCGAVVAEEALSKSPVTEYYALYVEKNTFAPGDIVKWKVEKERSCPPTT
jgi:hypothetical protein